MNRRLRTIVGTMVAIAALLWVGYSAFSANVVYYLTVNEYMEKASTGHIRVAGQVVDGSVTRGDDQRTVSFRMKDIQQPREALPVRYQGVIPDSFKDGSHVVVEGRLKDGTFEADTLLAKCPSKYEAASPAYGTPGTP